MSSTSQHSVSASNDRVLVYREKRLPPLYDAQRTENPHHQPLRKPRMVFAQFFNSMDGKPPRDSMSERERHGDILSTLHQGRVAESLCSSGNQVRTASENFCRKAQRSGRRRTFRYFTQRSQHGFTQSASTLALSRASCNIHSLGNLGLKDVATKSRVLV